jgi:CheY-like chemotaxis protein
MPDMDGFAVAERIKRDPTLAEATIMMLTSNRQRGDAERCRELGIAAYLTKPITHSELLDAILTVLGQKAQDSRPAQRIARPAPSLAEHRLRVLLTEDNLLNQGLAVRMLEKRGHTVVVSNNGREALEVLEKSGFAGFDVVLMDVQMPEMDGFEATAAIRTREKELGVRIPIIAMTAHALKGDRERCLAAGMDGYLPKPVQAADLIGEVERHAAGDGAPSAEPPAAATAVEPTNGQVLDRTALLQCMGGDSNLLVELVKIFLEESPKLLAAIQEAAARDDAQALERAAHSLKGTLSTFAAPAATAAALRLETIGCAGDLAPAGEACAALEKEMGRLKPLLEGLCEEVAQ